MKNIKIKMNDYLYPSNSVRWSYSLLGGPTGGAIVGAILGLLSIFDGPNIAAIMFIIMLSVIFGFVIGLLPSIITGVWIAREKIQINDAKDYLRIFFIGCSVSSIYALIALLIVSGYSLDTLVLDVTNLFKGLMAIAAMGWLGGMSSIVLGKLVVPKGSVEKKEVN